MKNAAMIANATLRHKFGVETNYRDAGPVGRQLKSYFGRAIRIVGLAAKRDRTDYVTFKVDANVPGFIVDTDPYERNF